MKALVLTVSDRASKGIYDDKSGPAIVSILREHFPEALFHSRIVSDDADEILQAFRAGEDYDLIITTGGTGLGPRDNTPDVTASYCDRLIPGIGEYLRSESRKETSNAILSRGTAGLKGSTLIINLPGSFKGAFFCTKALIPVLEHALKMIKGEGH